MKCLRYETLRRASIRDTVPNIRCEEAKEVESIRETASAAKLGNSAYEDDVPHRNELPPREVLPYRRPGPTFGEPLGRQLKELSNPKQSANSPSAVAQPTASGNQMETHGHLR